LLVFCRSCRRQREADLAALANSGHGDVPLIRLKWRCGRCGSGADFVCTSTDALQVKPWRMA
jgi:hypothetical protein